MFVVCATWASPAVPHAACSRLPAATNRRQITGLVEKQSQSLRATAVIRCFIVKDMCRYFILPIPN